ncbi:helix-turn-helix domain-containing protein [Arthrobacter tecti]
MRESECAALTRAEVANLFGVDPRTITRAIEAGDIPSVRLGNRILIPREPLLALLTASGTPASVA